MTDSRLTLLLRLCDEALARDQASRAAYLDAECAGDASLRGEVEALLNDEPSARSFLESAAVIPPAEPLKIGQRLGPYEVTGLLGTGGMGAVYRARDTRLGRTVAIKVLAADVAMDDMARERFLEEARAVASLNDPRICALHDVGREGGVDFLVLEYVEGETLEERLTGGRLPLPVALEYGVQLADALAHAHRQGLVHRDIKPGNVIVTKSAVKLLDFGLARFKRSAAAAGTAAATAVHSRTKVGMLIGTVPYMAPEQLEAKEADARTDLFGLGCVLYEMLTGCRPFAGDSEASIIAAIKSAEPRPLAELQPLVPPVVEQAVARCLAKDAQDRWQSASDLADVLRWTARLPAGRVRSAMPIWRRPSMVALALALAALVCLAGWIVWRQQNTTTPQPQHFELSLSSLNASLASHSLAISPDGQTVVFAASRPGEPTMLYVRTLRDAAPRRLSGTEAAWLPFFSPDGQEIAFEQGRELVRLRLRDGVRQSICPAPEFAGGSWDDDGRIVYAGGYRNPGLASVSAEGGMVTSLLTADDKRLVQSWFLFPERLPGGAIAFTIRVGRRSEVAVYSPGHGLRRNVIPGGSRARYLGAGLLAYEAGGQLRVVGFDTARLERRGESSVVVDALAMPFDSPVYAVSRTGTLVYLPSYQGLSRLVWKDRRGNTTPLALPPRWFSPPPALSHDGRRLVVQVDEGTRRNLWIADVDGQVLEPLTDSGDDWLPEFWPDDTWVAFTRGETYDIWRVRLDRATTTIEPLVVSPIPKSMPAISGDGRTILFNYGGPRPQIHIWRRDLADPPDRISPFLAAASATHRAPAFSSNGRWLAYQSDASGATEVYVQPYPEGKRNQVSVGGGAWPRWNAALRDPGGGELFYEGPTDLFSVRIVNGRRAGPPVPLFRHVVGEGWDRIHERERRDYAVTGDGKRFLLAEKMESASHPSQIHVITNWLEELKQKVPVR